MNDKIIDTNSNLKGLTTLNNITLTPNDKIINYGNLYRMGNICVMTILFQTKSKINSNEALYTFPVTMKTYMATLLPASSGVPVQVYTDGNKLMSAKEIPANIAVGGVLVFFV